MKKCVLLVFMFFIHYCCRYYTNNTPWNNETALLQNSNEVDPGGKCKGSILAAYEHNLARRIKRELTCLAQLFIFAGLVIFRADFMNVCVCVHRYLEYS